MELRPGVNFQEKGHNRPDHKTGHCENTNLHYSNLIDYAKSTFQVQYMPYRWSTQDCMTLDGVSYVGNLTSQSPNVYVATGFGKWGMTNSTAAAMMLKDLIKKGDSPWAPVYNPSRFSHAAEFLVQNLDIAKSFISGKLEQTSENEEVGKGEAKVISVDGKKAGAYRDENDKLHLLDITCTHIGCELEWNSAERSWDCHCHGSRFDYEGNIIEGPALNCLKEIKEDPNKVEPNVFNNRNDNRRSAVCVVGHMLLIIKYNFGPVLIVGAGQRKCP